MSLSSGTRFGAYAISAPLGAGGMGEVYRATDTTLGRDVAIKILPAELAQDPERLARFEREAKLLASLNHPNIAHVYGFEKTTLPDGSAAHFLAMELVPGEDLAERLKRGPMPVDETTAIAKQIAEALEEAHEKGIVHRDLKPANVKVTPDGKVKVLDFGLAKAWSGDGSGAASSGNLSESPTLAHTGTAAGLILGTAAYMSPEQARGLTVDKRSDVWAFGVVLFEMLAGRRLFEGETVSDVLASVLKSEPEWAALPAATPHRLRHLLARCLERDSKRRLRDIGEARIALEPGFSVEPPVAARIGARGITPWLAAAAAILAGLSGIAVGRMASRPERTEAKPPVRFVLDTGRPLLSASWNAFGGLAVAADGQSLAYVAPDGAVERIFLRRMGSLETHPLPGTEGASNPFFSPDGHWLGFFAERSLKKISLDGGAPVPLAPASDNRGGTWTEADEIVFSPDPGAALLRIPAQGGGARPLTELDASRGEMSHRWPSVVAGKNAVLLTVKTQGLQSFDDAPIAVVSLAGGAPRPVLDGGTAASYSPSGHVVYARAGALLAVPFDAARLEVTGAPFTVLEAVSRSTGTGSAHYALSRSGTLVSLPGSVDVDNRALVRVDADGRVEALTREARAYGMVRTSPDGRRLALWIGVANDEIWTFEIERGILTRLAQGASGPVWSPDGQWIAYTMAAGEGEVVRARADGSGQPEVLLPNGRSDGGQSATAISPDGKLLAFTANSAETGSDIWTLSLVDRSRTLVLGTRANELAAAFSPDGRALAFVSDETGRSEVYVQPFPGPGARRQASVGGGWAPVWGRTAAELFYQRGTSLMGVSLRGKGSEPEAPREVRSGVLLLQPSTLDDVIALWDLAPGGRGFVMSQPLDQKQATTLTVDLNWTPGPSR